MEQETRNKLQRATQQIRRLLEDEFAEQLEGTFDILANGKILPEAGKHLDARQRLTRQKLVDAIEHVKACGKKPQEAVAQYTREAAFTFLNRFVALRMLEARGMLQECVARGDQSNGFKEFCGLAPGLASVDDGGYRLYLECLFDELSVEVKVLFDRRESASLLWPRRGALNTVLEILAQEDLAAIWAIDETIGWVYQYHNDPDERKKMREESSAPRNSRELAVRNQFFTPRYVVEFLTDNTLGRIWYEMCQGQTRLKDQCRYMVRRPTEIFLQLGELAPETAGTTLSDSAERQTQEELLRQPVHIPHRALKDPREIRLLDPACGSMHFGLYAFELFSVIYDEAWEIAHSPDAAARSAATFAPFVTFAATFANKALFLREVPRLIIQHNIHGIDIDPRAAQIANLAIWLRAQRSWHESGIDRKDRPQISRSNIVCAEPMPGEKGMLRDFVEQQFPESERPAFAFLLEKIFDKMSLAGEAGSLLQIEEEIRTAVTEAHSLARKQSEKRQKQLFADTNQPRRQQMEFDLRGLTDDEFWNAAEQRIYDALEAYAEQAENGGGFQRRLFADDAAQGFAFIDLCRKRYDVVVMNPPFGRRSDPSSIYFDEHYSTFKPDMGLAFVDGFSHRLEERGQLGALTSRTFLAGGSFDDWRKDVLLSSRPVRVLLDLGIGVLDDALVETCAYVVQHQKTEHGRFLRALEATDKAASVAAFFSQDGDGGQGVHAFLTPLAAMRDLPTSIMAYWLPGDVAVTIKKIGTLESIQAATKHGVQTTDDFQFMRLAWEVPQGSVSSEGRWPVLAKGGEYAPYFDNLHLCVDWMSRGGRLKEYLAAKRMRTQGSPDWTPWMNSHEDYFRAGLTFPARTASDFCPRILPAGCVFTASGQALLFPKDAQAFGYLGGAFTRAFKIIVDAFVCSGDNSVSGSAANTYRTGLVNALPLPTDVNGRDAQEIGEQSVHLAFKVAATEETSLNFRFSSGRLRSLKSYAATTVESEFKIAIELLALSELADRTAQSFFGFSDELLAHLYGPLPTAYPKAVGDLHADVLLLAEDKLVAEALKRHGPRRQLTKKTYVANRRLELLCHIFEVHPESIVAALNALNLWSELHPSVAEDEMSVALGCVFGRWDIRYATGERPAPELPDPFAPLPVCPPGQLQNAQGLPARPEDVPAAYPVRIPWDGILVDDDGHSHNIVGRLREVIELIWKDRAEVNEQEACEMLGEDSLRDYFRKPAGFFADHLKRYSKSRRQAPIYWPLSTTSGSYTLWIYYHRLTDQTLHSAIADFLDPKIKATGKAIDEARNKKRVEEVNELSDLLDELNQFREELERVIKLPWKPNLNDGVLITACPLWRLFRHGKWQKDLKACWEALSEGEYDWAHLAYSIWPDRVRDKCKADRSLAIAHNLEELCKTQEITKKTKKAKK